MQNLKDAEQFVRGIWHSYLEESDYSQLESVFDPQVTIIGTGEHEVSRSFGEFKHNIMKERAQRVTTFSILNEWYHLTFLAPELVLVMGEIHARENSQQPLVFENRFRVTMVLRYQQNGWKILHVHQSVPDPEQGEGEFFPHRMMEQRNRQLQQMVEDKTRALEESNRKMRQHLRHDYLTGLLNRKTVEQQISRLLQEGWEGVLIMADIDEFKKINDQYGHLVGDQVLESLGAAVSELFGADRAGRIGGDEFLFILPLSYRDAARLQELAGQLRKNWIRRQRQRGLPCEATLSMGASFCPQHGRDLRTLWIRADKALYQVKTGGKNGLKIAEAQEEK